jgi:hypothetical protein
MFFRLIDLKIDNFGDAGASKLVFGDSLFEPIDDYFCFLYISLKRAGELGPSFKLSIGGFNYELKSCSFDLVGVLES